MKSVKVDSDQLKKDNSKKTKFTKKSFLDEVEDENEEIDKLSNNFIDEDFELEIEEPINLDENEELSGLDNSNILTDFEKPDFFDGVKSYSSHAPEISQNNILLVNDLHNIKIESKLDTLQNIGNPNLFSTCESGRDSYHETYKPENSESLLIKNFSPSHGIKKDEVKLEVIGLNNIKSNKRKSAQFVIDDDDFEQPSSSPKISSSSHKRLKKNAEKLPVAPIKVEDDQNSNSNQDSEIRCRLIKFVSDYANYYHNSNTTYPCMLTETDINKLVDAKPDDIVSIRSLIGVFFLFIYMKIILGC